LPVAACDSPFMYVGLPHVINDESEQGLRGLVDSLFTHASQFNEDNLRELYRTASAFYFKHSTRFRSFEIRNGFDTQINIKSFEELRPGHDKTLDRVCDHLMYGSSVFDLPSSEDWTRSSAEEDQFLAGELNRIKRYRAEVLEESAKLNARQPPKSKVAVCRAWSNQTSTNSYFDAAWVSRGHSSEEFKVYQPVQKRELRFEEFLLGQLADVNQEFVVIAPEIFQYDESWMRASRMRIEQENNAEFVWSGAWISTKAAGITQSILVTPSPSARYSDLVKKVSSLSDPYLLLGLSLFRRTYLMSLLKQLLNLPVQDIGQEIIALLTRAAQNQAGKAMIVIHNDPVTAKQTMADQATNVPSALSRELPLTAMAATTNNRPEISERQQISIIEKAVEALQKEQNEAALQLLDQVIPSKQDMPMLYYARAVAQARIGKISEAIISLDTLLERDSNHENGRALLEQLKRVKAS